jgi:hypothetical protein
LISAPPVIGNCCLALLRNAALHEAGIGPDRRFAAMQRYVCSWGMFGRVTNIAKPVLKKKFEAARMSLVLRADPVIVVMKGLGGSSHGSKNILCGGWSDFCAGGVTPSLADLHGLARCDR